MSPQPTRKLGVVLAQIEHLQKRDAESWQGVCPACKKGIVVIRKLNQGLTYGCSGGCNEAQIATSFGVGACDVFEELGAIVAGSPRRNGHRQSLKPDVPSDERETHLPEIVVSGRWRREITADSLNALHKANAKPPFLFRRGTVIVRVAAKSATVERLIPAALGGVLDRVARYYRVTFDKNGGERKTPARPPADVVADLLTIPDLALPVLTELRSAPVFVPNGLLTLPGYDTESGIYLVPTGLDAARTDMPVEEARRLILDDLLGDFPFANQPSRAHALGLLLLPFVRPLIGGPCPLHLIDAPSRGTGKGLLADIVALVALGTPAHAMALTQDTDELEKRVTAMLVAAAPMILLDNVIHLSAASLCVALTTTNWRGRILGESRMIEVPNHATWLATGNNVTLSDEMVRRIVPIRLDAGVERPEDRTNWRHANLLAWTRDNRCELVGACISLVRAWIDAGMPRGTATLGRFEEWSAVVGGICTVSGVLGLLEGRDALRTEADRETQDWVAFCAAWWTAYEALPVTASDLFEIAKAGTFLLDVWGGRKDLSASQRIGHALAAKRDRVFGGYVIHTAGRDARTGNAAYRLDRPGQDTPETPETVNCSASRTGVSGVSGVYSDIPDAAYTNDGPEVRI